MKTLLMTFVVLCCTVSVQGQLLGPVNINLDEYSFPDISNDSTVILKKMIKSGLFISKQSFQIYDKENDNLFGLNGKKEFGIQYSVGVKIPDGLLLTDRAVRPWLYDPKYEKYKEKYEPVFFQAMYAEIGDKLHYRTLKYKLSEQQVLLSGGLYRFFSTCFDGKGFVLEKTEGAKSGWLVWITCKKNADLDHSTGLDYIIHKKEVIVDKRKCTFSIEGPETADNVLLGIYIVPVCSQIGVLEFRLCGIVVPDDKAWKLCCPFAEENNCEKVESKSQEKVEEPAELTLIEKDKAGENSETKQIKTKKRRRR